MMIILYFLCRYTRVGTTYHSIGKKKGNKRFKNLGSHYITTVMIKGTEYVYDGMKNDIIPRLNYSLSNFDGQSCLYMLDLS